MNAPEKIRCDACPVMCYIAPGQTGACDRYGNVGRPHRPLRPADRARPHPRGRRRGWCPSPPATGTASIAPDRRAESFVTGIGAGTTYPDYKPAPFIVSREVEGADVVTVVTEAIFSYCGVKVKIDTDRHLGPERAVVRADGEAVGHVTTAEYGSQMLSLGGVEHLTGGSQGRGPRHLRRAARALQPRAGRARRRRRRHASWSQAGRAPVVDGVHRAPDARRLRLGHHRHVRRASGAGWSTRWWWSTTTSPASSPSTRPARCSAGSRPASASAATARRPGATSGSPSPASAGAAPASPTRSRSSPPSRRARAPAPA